MTLLLDADSMIYIIAYNNREDSTEDIVRNSCDSFFRDILIFSGADDYIGVFSSDKSFRNEIYKFAPYKGNRKEKPEYIELYAPVIKKHFTENYGFVTVQDFEADDVIVALATHFTDKAVIASPDKDLRQIAGYFIDYSKSEFQIISVGGEEANYDFWMQMLTGDSTDNVAGVPGLGDVKGRKILSECLDPMGYESAVRFAYNKYFGDHYGPIIYRDTFDTLKMVTSSHIMWPMLKPHLETIQPRTPKAPESIFDAS